MPDAKPDFKYLGGFNYVLDDDESQREESEKPAGLYPRTMTPRWEDVRKLATPSNGYPLNDNHDNIAFEQLLMNGTLDLQRRGDKQQIVPGKNGRRSDVFDNKELFKRTDPRFFFDINEKVWQRDAPPTPVVPTAVATPVVPPPKSHAGKRVPPANWGSELRKETRGADGYAPGYPLHLRTCVGADGCPLQAHTRVQTQWTREKGRDDRWHAGSVSAVLASGEVTIKYDDGGEWTGSAMDVHLLNSAHPLKSGSCVEQIWDMVFKILGRTLGCLARANLLGPLLAMIIVIPFLLCAFGDRRTGEIALWFKLDSCLSKTTPAFVYTLRAAAAAGARGGVPTPGLALALTHVLALA